MLAQAHRTQKSSFVGGPNNFMPKKSQPKATLRPMFGRRLDAPVKKRADMPAEHQLVLDEMFPKDSADQSNADKLRENGHGPIEKENKPHIRRGSPGQI
jgi:hypothetical protein